MDLSTLILGNPIRNWLLSCAVLLSVFIILVIVRRNLGGIIQTFAKRTRTDLDDLAADLIKGTKTLVLLIIALYAASFLLFLPVRIVKLMRVATIIALMIQGAFWGNAAIVFWVERYRKRVLETDATGVVTAHVIGFIARLLLFTVVLLLALENMGMDVTALVASLGVGSVAIALAVQNVLKDLFACLSIAIDKPFVIGDFIIIDSYLGVVEHVGLKTTRIRSLSGEQLVFSNDDLLNSRIRNYKRMFERRVVFSFGVIYQTTADQLEEIPKIVKEIIEQQDKVRFDRAHFKEYGDSSLDFEVVYYVLAADYNLYMDIQQAINLAIFRAFDKNGISFAYPTRTIYMEHSGPETA